MRRALPLLLLALPGLVACGGGGGGDGDVSWEITITGGETTGTTTGGLVIQGTGSGKTGPAWLLGDPLPFVAEDPADPDAIAEAAALAGPDRPVLDAIRLEAGLAALLADPEGPLLALLGSPGGPAVRVPEDVRRVLPDAFERARVLLPLDGDLALPATLLGH